MSVVVRAQCSANARNGQRCKLTTLRGTLCWQHLRSVKGLRVKTSEIPDAGFGLFTTVNRVKGEDLAPYTGDVVVNPPVGWGGDYVLQLKKNPPTYIDARRTNTGEGRYANSMRGRGRRNNAQLVLDRRNGIGRVRAVAKIASGKEITVAYGGQYWKGRGVM